MIRQNKLSLIPTLCESSILVKFSTKGPTNQGIRFSTGPIYPYNLHSIKHLQTNHLNDYIIYRFKRGSRGAARAAKSL